MDTRNRNGSEIESQTEVDINAKNEKRWQPQSQPQPQLYSIFNFANHRAKYYHDFKKDDSHGQWY
jgi:hypothetical protein